MRIAAFLAIALLSASLNSQELVSLAIEPELETPAPTLESAARANDFPTFDALYRAEPDLSFRTLHELWTYSMTDPLGAFYGAELYERLSREYPGYAEFIEPHRIVDSGGNVFYPASETRAFLLAHREVAQPRVVPRTVIAEARRPLAGRSTGSLPVEPREKPVPAGSRRTGRPAAGAPIVAEAVAPLTTVVSEPVAAPTLAIAPPPTAPAPAPAAAPRTTTNGGLLLIIIGLLGVGLLALIVRAPREVIP